eukprot:NP_492819.2 Uncharacterized protein CELE_F55A3.6 [Caenorhabditis elegans]
MNHHLLSQAHLDKEKLVILVKEDEKINFIEDIKARFTHSECTLIKNKTMELSDELLNEFYAQGQTILPIAYRLHELWTSRRDALGRM